ncbi:hypothetical protein CJU90_0915 [Yarrowia sp. C11]|nr:hypothetical protein CJU90_0915 [Yarrowia sp. C11]
MATPIFPERVRNGGEVWDRIRETFANVESTISSSAPQSLILRVSEALLLRIEKEDPRSRGEKFLLRMNGDVEGVLRKLRVTPYSESRQECLSAALDLVQRTEKVWKHYEEERLEVTSKLLQFKALLLKTFATFGGIDLSVSEFDRDTHTDRLFDIFMSTEEILGSLEPRMAGMKLQQNVHRLLRVQDSDMVQSVIRQVLNRYTCHLDRKPERSGAEVSLKEGSRRLPSEVAHMIFSFCDLESCVALRNANSFWFRQYSQAEHILKPALRKRAPWLQPEGDMKTWADCVLVFVSRLTSKKCRRVENVFKKTSSPKQTNFPSPKPTKAVLSLQFLFDTMPADFEGFDDHREFCCSAACDRLHLHNIKKGAIMNPWTKDIERFTPRKMDFSSAENETVIGFQDFEITLPGVFRKADMLPNGSFLGLPPIVVLNDLVVVSTAKGQFVLPRENPHYKNPDTLRFPTPPGYMHTVQFGDVFANLSQHGLWIYDPHVKKLVQVDNISGTNTLFPIDIHAGLVWYLHDERFLVPTFTDTKTPDALYCHEDKVITLPTCVDRDRIRKCRRSENKHFLTMPGYRGSIRMVDLDSGVVTEVVPSEGHVSQGKPKIFLGWVDGQFQALDICTETIVEYLESHWDVYWYNWDMYDDYHSRFPKDQFREDFQSSEDEEDEDEENW